ncbi:hypothetical protein AQJ43_32095 [Streptomyces avermitilis]|uniref:Uncharacterized protein n=2 Tax=Streptomyces avermitilis TaxID=33903 RepID=Q82KA0_STRAW|nr:MULTISPECIES: hypothetical protein [Streptomyces]KUN50484.1 hypothetical protein AQJ43_32095 [Streptomyces avermitilis]MYS98109.1 hypothetical protein [Streptomyces sp. SID5469]OOV33468.1 hypothetical protein SM007_12280 [Streptomyces avermitilis]BAC70214.1 hypothetical protein SAVERM_2503 [Streptomyces avermitilis MA-4680 = NBRC 14893]BBJ50300.1 hypothetical protein SAVMC3_29290 [Streptomyces avermitilis]
MAGRIARWGVALALGALWWWGVLRLVLVPDSGVLEGAVVAGGWGLSLLPVHCVPKARVAGAAGSDQWAVSWQQWRSREGRAEVRRGGDAPRA